MTDSILGRLGGFFGLRKPVETEKTTNEPKEEGSDIKFATETVADVSDVIDYLLKLHSYKNKKEFKKHIDRNALSYLASLKDKFVLLKSKLDEAEKASPSVKDFAIIKFCRSIAENDELHKELSNLAKKCRNDGIHKKLNVLAKKYRNVPHATSYERLYPQLDKIVGNLNKDKLKEKISFLKKLKEKSDFNAIRNGYSNAWDFDSLLRDLIGDKNFKEEYIDKALDEEGESFSKSFKKDLNEYIELANHGEAAASKYFGEEVEFQAYYAKANDGTSKILNINIIGRGGSEPTKISDILQKEENISELNIYYKKKHEVRAYRDEKERRYYEFKEDASYEMTSTWRAEDESGNTSICKMIMNVDSSGIAKIVEFNGRKSEFLSEDDLELVKQNDALYIQGLSLYNGVKKWLGPKCTESVRVIEPEKVTEKDNTLTMPDVVPVANHSTQADKTIEEKQNPNEKGTNVTKSDIAAAAIAICNTPASKIIQPIAPTPQVTVDNTPSSTISTFPVAKTIKEIAPQAEVDSQQMDELANLKQEALELKKENVELKQGAEAGLQAMNQKYYALEQEKQRLHGELEATQTEKEGLHKELVEISELDKGIKHTNTQLKNEVERLNGEMYDLQDKLKKIEEEKGLLNHRIVNGQLEIVQLIRCDSDLKNKLAETGQIIERFEKQNDDLRRESNKMRDKLAQLEEEKAKELETASEEKEKFKSELRITKEKNKKLENAFKKMEEQGSETEEEAARIVSENNQKNDKALQDLKSQMLELAQDCEEKLKSSAKKSEKQLWEITELKNELDRNKKTLESYKNEIVDLTNEVEKLKKDALVRTNNNENLLKIKELQNELNRKKEKFQEAEKVYGELKSDHKALIVKHNFLVGMQVVKEKMIEESKDGAKELKEIIADKTYNIEDLKKENKNLEEETKSLKRQVEILSEETYPLNHTTDAQKANDLSRKQFHDILNCAYGLKSLFSLTSTETEQPLSSSSSSDSGLSSGEEDNSPKGSRPRSPSGSKKSWSERELAKNPTHLIKVN